MKKFLYTIGAFALALCSTTSCENDEIEIANNSVRFTINLANVMDYEGYDEMVHNGMEELEQITTVDTEKGYQLRVRNFVYNEKGILVNQTVDFSSTYKTTIRPKFMINSGKYKVLTLTDIVKKNDNGKVGFHYWDVTDSVRFADTKLVPTGYIGYYQSLGIAVTDIDVDENKNNTYTVVPRPAGSMAYIYYKNFRDLQLKNNPVTYIAVCTKHKLSFYYFEGNNYEMAEQESTSYDWRIDYLEPNKQTSNQNVKHIYDFTFFMSCSKHPMAVYYRSKDNYQLTHSLGDWSFKKGVMYAFHINGKNMEYPEDADVFAGTGKEYVEYLSTQSAPHKTQSAINTANLKFQPNMFDQSDWNVDRFGYKITDIVK